MHVTILTNLVDGGFEVVQKKINVAKTQLMGPACNTYALGNLNIMNKKLLLSLYIPEWLNDIVNSGRLQENARNE
jgi:hypothetical protein